MRILFLTHRVPYPPNKGDKLRAFNILKHLSRRHLVHLACLSEDRSDLEYRDELTKYAQEIDVVFMSALWRRFKSAFYLFSKRPLTLPHFYSQSLAAKIKKAMDKERFDLIYIYSSCMAQYVLEDKKTRKIMDFIDVDSDKWYQYSQFARFPLNIIYGLEGAKLRRYEEKIAANVEKCIAVSNEEIGLFKSFLPKEKLLAISNGVDFEYFKPGNNGYERNRLIFTGAMDYFANVDAVLYFYRAIFPLIRKQVPGTRLFIVGANPSKEVQALARDRDVTVTGFVEDIRPYLERSSVCVAPLRIGRGIRNKILEAMSMGVPVVTMTRALFGIDAMPERDIFIADEPEQFAKKTINLLKDNELRQKTSKNSRKLIQEKFDWGISLDKLHRLIHND